MMEKGINISHSNLFYNCREAAVACRLCVRGLRVGVTLKLDSAAHFNDAIRG